jgi:hypothetical protein
MPGERAADRGRAAARRHLQVPGFGSETVRPYKRPALSELHRARAAAVRKAAVDAAPAAPAPAGDAREPAAAPQAAQVLHLARPWVEAWVAWRVLGRRR